MTWKYVLHSVVAARVAICLFGGQKARTRA